MATTEIVQGKNLRAYVNGSPIGYATDFTLTMTTTMIETLHKDSGANIERAPDQNDWTASGSYFMSFEANAARTLAFNIFTAQQAQAEVTMVFQTAITGDLTLTGSGYFDNTTITGNVGERAAGTWNVVANGAIVLATY